MWQSACQSRKFQWFWGLPVFWNPVCEIGGDGWDRGCDAINFTGQIHQHTLVFGQPSSRIEKDGGWLREWPGHDPNSFNHRWGSKAGCGNASTKKKMSVCSFFKEVHFDRTPRLHQRATTLYVGGRLGFFEPLQFTSVFVRVWAATGGVCTRR